MISLIYSALPSVRSLSVATATRWFARKQANHRQAASLRSLTDDQLRDIGISRAMADEEAARLEWDAPIVMRR